VAKDNIIPDQASSATAESSSRQTRSNHQSNPPKRNKGKGKSQDITEEQPSSRTSKKYVSNA